MSEIKIDPWITGYFWFLTIVGAFFLGAELGLIEGSHEERIISQRKLESCQKVIAGSMYE